MELVGPEEHGVGLGRWCYWPVWMRRNGQRFWAIALEKFGAPTPMGHYPPGDDASRARLLDVLRSLAAGSGVALPEGQDIELLAAVQRAGGDFAAFAGYMDKMLAKVILGQSSTTEQGPWRGTAEVQKDVRDEVIASDCRLLGESATRTIAAWLTAWNFPGAAGAQDRAGRRAPRGPRRQGRARGEDRADVGAPADTAPCRGGLWRRVGTRGGGARAAGWDGPGCARKERRAQPRRRRPRDRRPQWKTTAGSP